MSRCLSDRIQGRVCPECHRRARALPAYRPQIVYELGLLLEASGERPPYERRLVSHTGIEPEIACDNNAEPRSCGLQEFCPGGHVRRLEEPVPLT